MTFQLADGSRWHASCLLRVPAPMNTVNVAIAPVVRQDNPVAMQPTQPPEQPALSSPEPRHVRIHAPLGHFQDFDTTVEVRS